MPQTQWRKGGIEILPTSIASWPIGVIGDVHQDLIAFLQSLTDDALLRDPRWSDPWALEP